MLEEAEARDQLNREYLATYHAYTHAEGEEKDAQLARLRQIVLETARQSGFSDAIPEQTLAYRLHASRAPRRSMKVYKVFTLSDDGHPTALFISGTEKLPLGVWLDAQDTFHFRAKNGKDYVPSTQNPFTDGGKTGASIEIPDDAVRQELIARGFLPNGSSAKRVTALAYRPGWHAGTLPFFPQGGKRAPKDSPYPNIHRYNQVVFECEVMADEDYTAAARAQEKAQTKDGRLNLARADLQYLPKDGFYYYATNPLTQNNPNLGAWVITGSIKINRALTQEECDAILAEHGMEPQAWEQGTLDLSTLGYTGDESEAARKTLAPITYDDAGHVIPLSDRFNAEIQDVRYQERGDRGETGLTEHLALRKKNEKALRASIGDDGMQVYEEAKEILSSGNEAVKNAASISAAVLATRAKVWSEEQKKAGHAVNATDYMKTIGLVSDSKSFSDDEAQLMQSALTAEQRLKADMATWRNALDRAWNAEKGGMLRVMDTPLVFEFIGGKHLPLMIAPKKLQEIKRKHPGMSKAVFYQLPKYLADPMFIFKSDTVEGRFVATLSLKDKSNIHIVVPILLDAKSSRVDVNVLNSVYGRGDKSHTKDQLSWFIHNIQDGNTLYINKKQAAKFYQSAGLQLPLEGKDFNDLFGSIIRTEEDLVKLKNKNPTFYQMAGSHARTADFQALQHAQNMEYAGKDADAIWKETGWTKGRDDKWRFEIPDNLDSIHLDAFRYADTRSLRDIYTNRTLYAAYPNLKYIQVKVFDLPVDTRAATINHSVILLNRDKIDDKDMPATLIHEIQHIIQGREGFAVGGSISTRADFMKDEAVDTDMSDAAFYRSLGGEQEARMTADRAKRFSSQEQLLKRYHKSVQEVREAIPSLPAPQQKAVNKFLSYPEMMDDDDAMSTFSDYPARYPDVFEAMVHVGCAYQELTDARPRPIPHDSEAIILFGGKPVEALSELQLEMAKHPVKPSIQGKFSIDLQGKRKIDLMETADETTFLHEMGHVLYDDLCLLSRSGDEQADRDFKTVQKWAEWNPEQIKEYSDTPWSKEFMKRDAAIRFAIAHGDTEEESRLRTEWREERFARGFERYLQKGKAPTPALSGVFARCKKLFMNAYHAFRSLGGSPAPAVEKVMARMLTPQKQDAPNQTSKKEAFRKACKPCFAEYQRRVNAIQHFEAPPKMKKSLPQNRFMQVMHDSFGKLSKEGKPIPYEYLAVKALYDAKVPKKQIVACINKFAPNAAKDPARKKVYGTIYADYLTKCVENSKSFQAQKKAAKGR